MAYTTIDDPSAYFQTNAYTGDGNDDRNLVNTGNSDLQPDWVWIKCRSAAKGHNIFDSSRGTSAGLSSDNTNAEFSDGNRVQAFQTDGFQLGSNSNVNENTTTFVAWQWKANGGSRTTFSASGNQLAGGYQANTTAGFSIVDYTGNATNGATFPHGLGATPTIAIIKDRTNAGDGGGTNWIVAYTIVDGSTDRLYLNDTNAHYDLPDGSTEFRVDFSSSNVTLGTWNNINASGTHIAYVFTPIQGYSKFGTYTGNANDDGPFIYTGFKPKYAIFKSHSAAGEGWAIRDSARSPFNQMSHKLSANVSASEGTTADDNDCDFLSNGIKLRSNDNQMNKTGTTFIYMAFAEHPFVSSEGVPVTAR
jgi:hypothetical protein